jgi:hypothetical protein
LRKTIPSDGSWNTWLMAGLMLCAALGTQLLSLMETIGPLVYLSAVFSGFALALLYPTLTTYLSFCAACRFQICTHGDLHVLV